jgi:histidinol-phosphate aminotransferase
VGNGELIKHLRKVQLPYNLSIVNQKILEIVMEERAKVLESVKSINRSKKKLYGDLEKIKGVTAYPSKANYILIKIDQVDKVCDKLKADKIHIRRFSAPELKDYMRVTVGTEAENRSFIETLRRSL